MAQLLVGAQLPFAALEDVEDVKEPSASVDALGILRELAAAWKRLAVADE